MTLGFYRWVLWVRTQFPCCCCILHGAAYWNRVGCGSGCSFTRNCTAVPRESSDNRLKCCVPGVIFLNLKNFPSVKAYLPHGAGSEQCEPLSCRTLSFVLFLFAGSRGTGRRLGNALAVLQEMQIAQSLALELGLPWRGSCAGSVPAAHSAAAALWSGSWQNPRSLLVVKPW